VGRGIRYNDMPAVRSIVRESAANNYRFSSIISGIITSTPVQMRITPIAAGATAASNAGDLVAGEHR
jgi:hypothetical protein